MIELVGGAAAGLAASESSAILHNTPGSKDTNDYLAEACETLHLLIETLSKQPATTIEERKTVLTWQSKAITIRHKAALGIFILVGSTSTFNVTVSGIGTFVWTPNVGTYNRWRYPDGTTIQLVTPNTGPNFPIEILYTNDLES
jgi:hypothetical protein